MNKSHVFYFFYSASCLSILVWYIVLLKTAKWLADTCLSCQIRIHVVCQALKMISERKSHLGKRSICEDFSSVIFSLCLNCRNKKGKVDSFKYQKHTSWEYALTVFMRLLVNNTFPLVISSDVSIWRALQCDCYLALQFPPSDLPYTS
jgi:hypothetical protein